MNSVARGIGLALGLICLGTAAEASPGFATADVNMRAGPDTQYPRVTVLPQGAQVDIVGCLSNQSWCDVAYGPYRGWVFGEYLGFVYQGRQVLVPEYAPVIGLPIVGFNFGNYWGNYYRGSPWWNQYNRWQGYNPRPRPGWGAPPPGYGPRPPGWWNGGPGRPGGPGGPGRPGGYPGQPGWQGYPNPGQQIRPIPGQPDWQYGNPGRPPGGNPGNPGRPGWQGNNNPGNPGNPGRPGWQGNPNQGNPGQQVRPIPGQPGGGRPPQQAQPQRPQQPPPQQAQQPRPQQPRQPGDGNPPGGVQRSICPIGMTCGQ